MAAVAFSVPAFAGERRFAYSYQPSILPPGEVELEQWVTARAGKRSGDFARFDLRTELELGLLDGVQTAIYLNYRFTRSLGVPEGASFSDTEELKFEGVSNEWILKLLDPVADPVGLALYFEWEAGPKELALEQKLILGKTIGPWDLALNVIVEEEWELERERLVRGPGPMASAGKREIERELAIELTGGASYRIGSFAVGLEARSHSEFEDYKKTGHTAFFFGPNLHFRTDRVWLTLAVLPQLGAHHPSAHGLELQAHERVEARLLFSVSL